MILIIGGYAQGKTEYAGQHYRDAENRILYLNDRAKQAFEKGVDPLPEILDHIKKNPQVIIITEEVGKGVVPLDKADRQFRERVGRVQIELAKIADEVVRVTCGIGQKIK